MQYIKRVINEIKKQGYYPDIKVINGKSSTSEITIEGKKLIQFSSANYLGFANNVAIKQAVIEGMDHYDLHPTSSSLVSGTLDIHKELEKKIALIKGTEDAMIFITGTMANIGVLPAFVNLPLISISSVFKNIFKLDKTVIFSDELNHATIIDGCRLSKAKIEIYKHNDLNDLEKKIKQHKKKRKLIVTDGVFSMDGDIAKLKEIVALSKEYKSNIMVDDAHGTGVLGKYGKGTIEHLGINSGINIHMGTFDKALGLLGAFIAGDKDLIDYLRISSRTSIFTGAFWGAISNGIIKSLELSNSSYHLREKLWSNSQYLRDSFLKMGFNTLNSQNPIPIIPILIGKDEIAISFARDLFNFGIMAPCIRWPAVRKDKAIIRISTIATHEKKHLEYLLEIFEKLGHKYHII